MGIDKVRFKYSDLVFSSGSDLEGQLVQNGGKLWIDVGNSFEIKGYFHLEGDENDKLSHVSFFVDSLKVDVEIDGINLNLDSIQYETNAIIQASSNREDIISQNQIDELKLNTLENWLTQFSPKSILDSFFQSSFSFSINELYPSFNLRAPLDYKVVQGHLVVYPDNVLNIREIITCSVYDSSRGVEISNTKPVTNQQTGEATWDVILNDGSSNLNLSLIRDDMDGEIGLFVPKPILEKSFKENIPSLSSKLKGRSLVRYDGWLTTRLDKVDFSIDPSNLALKTELHIGAHAYINFTFKIDCIGKVDIGWGKVNTKEPLKVWLNTYLMPQEDQLVGKSKIQSLKVAKFDAKIELFSKWLGWIGPKSLIISWFFDYLIGSKIAYKATLDTRRIAFEKINENNITFIDLGHLSEFLYSPYGHNSTYSGTKKSALFGLARNQG